MMLCVVSASASKVVYLNPGVWDADDATERYAVYVFNSETDNAWVAFEKVGDLYKAGIDDKWGNMILVRLNGETTENNWDNKWNQTADIVMANIADQTLFVMSDWSGYNTVPYDLYCDNDAIAIEQLIEVVDSAAKGEGGTEELQAEIDAVVKSNADQEKDETAKVSVDYKDWTGATGFATWAAPKVTTYDGRETYVVENYNGSTGATTGDIFSQTVTGLANGKYKVAFYANANSTADRDGAVETGMEDGAEDVAYVYANEAQKFVVAHRTTSITANDEYSFDMELTTGTIKLGLAKAKAGTNWHTMQIKQLTWFATAKEVFAELQKDLKAALEEANALYNDDSKTEGKDALKGYIDMAKAAVDSKYFTIKQVEDILKDLKQGMANFKKANWYIGFGAGEYYIIDAESGLMMAAGHDYGTRGIVNEMGLDLMLTPHAESRTVSIDSRVSNGGDSHFLGVNLYMDSSEWGWALEYQGFGFYILDPDGGKYINIDSDNNLVLSDTPREFIIVTKDGVVAQRLGELADATAENPVDATFLLQNPNFNRNDQRVSAWTISEDCTNSNLNGGNQVNNCAESFHSTFTIMQTVSGAPAGFYQMTAQGFYRQDEYEGEEAPAAPMFFANGINGNVPEMGELPDHSGDNRNGMDDASVEFTNGNYTINPITFEVKDDGMMYVGVTASTNTQWVIWDNFQLKYFGKNDPTVGIQSVATESAKKSEVYNLAGQRVMSAQKGLYIINGKKVVR